jgi:hypothetical protein
MLNVLPRRIFIVVTSGLENLVVKTSSKYVVLDKLLAFAYSAFGIIALIRFSSIRSFSSGSLDFFKVKILHEIGNHSILI